MNKGTLEGLRPRTINSDSPELEKQKGVSQKQGSDGRDQSSLFLILSELGESFGDTSHEIIKDSSRPV